jgi:integrase
MAKHPYLKPRPKRAGLHYVRFVPRRLQGPGRPTAIYRVLGEDRVEVERAYAMVHAEVEALFARWETETPTPVVVAVAEGLTPMSTSVLRRIIAEHRAEVLRADLDMRTAELEVARADPDSFVERLAKLYHGDDYYLMLAGDEGIEIDGLLAFHLHRVRKQKLEKLRAAMRLGDLTPVSGAAATVANKFNNEDRRHLMQALLDAEIGVLARIVASDTKLFDEVHAEVSAVRAETATPTAVVTWEDCINAWWRFHEAEKKPLDSRRQCRAFFEKFAKWVGKPPMEVTKQDVKRYRDERLTAGISPSTIKSRDITMLRVLFDRAAKEDILPIDFINPTKGVDVPKLSDTAPERVEPRGYNDHESYAILAAAEQEKDPLYRWVPLLMYYSGARVGEPVHLRPDDVRRDKDTGIWCWFPTQHEGERTQKTGFSGRPIPLHASMRDEFLSFVADKREARQKYLFFQDWNPRDQTSMRVGIAQEKPGKKSVERLREWVHKVAKKHGFKVGGVVGLEPNHGWRYRFETLCERAQISDDVQRWFTGHFAKDAHGNYKKPDAHTMAEALERFPNHRVKPSVRKD